MKKYTNVILKPLVFTIILAVSFVSCNEDFTDIDSDIKGAQNFNATSLKFPVVAYNKTITPAVQTNKLTANLLGIYDDPIYGRTTANIVTQIVPTTYNPDFGDNPEIDSVVLEIPYFSKLQSIDDNGNNIYTLDSVYGNQPFKLTVYRNNYFMSDYEVSNPEEAQTYYSNANYFDSYLGEKLFEGEINIDASEIVITETDLDTGEDEVVERKTPRLKIDIMNDISTGTPDPNFWKNILIDNQENSELSNANNFKEFFRGLHFVVEPINNQGSMVMFNFYNSSAGITMYYTTQTNLDDDDTIEDKTFKLNFTENRVNLLQNDYTITLQDGDATNGDAQLYLKGGAGSIAVLDLFNGVVDNSGTPENALEFFKTHKEDWLINEAQLIIYEDETVINSDDNNHEYDRIYLYDLKNNIPIYDYYIDLQNANDPYNSVINHLGQRVVENGVAKYKIRLTEHINNILLKDSTNLQLGLAISTNVNRIESAKILDAQDTDVVRTVPQGTVLSTKGTVLHGSNSSVPQEKRIELEIYYTEIQN